MEKLKRVFNYIFSGYPFKKDSFNYEEYWGQFSESGDYLISPFKLKLFKSLISEGSSVLDIGCGNGMLLDHLKKTRYIQDSGIEISAKAVEMARQKGINAVQGDITSSDFKLERTYDYIIISEVLEHLPKPENVLEKLKGKFTKNLIITILRALPQAVGIPSLGTFKILDGFRFSILGRTAWI
jgi:2-polyprenyl-3-methyl-5-hydroxy-6-metoxy-1,4-benzoquinol methylase